MARQSTTRRPISTIWLLSVSRRNAALVSVADGTVSLVMTCRGMSAPGRRTLRRFGMMAVRLLLQVGSRLHALLRRLDGVDAVPVDRPGRAFDLVVLLPLVAEHWRRR